jgi:hypothetical protein
MVCLSSVKAGSKAISRKKAQGAQKETSTLLRILYFLRQISDPALDSTLQLFQLYCA